MGGAVACAAGLCGGLAQAAPRDWVGSARCGACHPAQLAAWQATAHARRLIGDSAAMARCLGCHTTGDWPAGAVVEPQVGCEACHGAGADYAAEDLMRNRRLALDLGLSDLRSPAGRAQLCATCHAAVSMRQLDLSRPAHPVAASRAGGAP